MGLSSCKGKTIILVVIDKLSKYGHFIALSHPYTTVTIAQAFIDNAFKLHGMPNSIVSDSIQYFSVLFGENCLNYKVPSYAYALDIIPRVMVKLKS